MRRKRGQRERERERGQERTRTGEAAAEKWTASAMVIGIWRERDRRVEGMGEKETHSVRVPIQ